MTVMIDHENNEKKNMFGYSSTLGTLSSDCLACSSSVRVQSIDVRREGSLALKSLSDVWVSYIHI